MDTGVDVAVNKRVTIYIPEEILEELVKAYPECRSEGEAIVKHILEVHAG